MAVKKTYTRAVFRTPAALADEAAGILVAGGALGCSVAGMAAPHSPARETIALEAWFEHASGARLAQLRQALGAAGMLADGRREPVVRQITDPGWATIWMKRFGPFHVGRRFLIAPPWKPAAETGRVSIVIQAAQAFGTGHHPTTAGVLRAIESLAGRHVPRSALDVGTGSGILSIAMALLGVRKIMAIDVDTTALENAHVNARLNRVDQHIRISPVPLESIRRHFDLVTANILAETLIEAAPLLKRVVAPSGRLVLGGILAREAESVLHCYRDDLRCISRKTSRGWTTLVLAR